MRTPQQQLTSEACARAQRSATSRSTGRELPGGGFADSGGDLEADGEEGAYAQRQRLLQGTATLEDGSRRLEESHRLALQTEDMGADILRDLRGQREQIENSRDTVSLAAEMRLVHQRLRAAGHCGVREWRTGQAHTVRSSSVPTLKRQD